jgi:hypothetical protein
MDDLDALAAAYAGAIESAKRRMNGEIGARKAWDGRVHRRGFVVKREDGGGRWGIGF